MSDAFWTLEQIGDDNRPVERYRIDTIPCVIGRGSDCDLQLTLGRISRRHARLDSDGDQLVVEDLESTNGTFVDGHRIENTPVRLSVGSTLHLAEQEFRLVLSDASAAAEDSFETAKPSDPRETFVGFTGGPGGFPVQAPAFFELLNGGMVDCSFRPILNARGRTFGYELLAVPSHPKLTASMEAMFDLAEDLDESWALAELCCKKAIRAIAREDLVEPIVLPARVVAPLERPGAWLRQTIERESGRAPIKLIVTFGLNNPELDRAIKELMAAGMTCCVEATGPSDGEIKRLANRVSYLRLRIDPSEPSVASKVAACRSAGITCIVDAEDRPLEPERLRELGIELYLQPPD